MPQLYKIESPRSNWSDYGSILVHGMTAHLSRKDGMLQLERTGPYMPPITFPGIDSIVLTAKARALLETSGLTGWTFKPVIKARIVECHWETWDASAADPAEYPKSGEPEDYILDRAHSESLADQLGPVWEVDIVPTAQILRRGDWVRLVAASWDGTDLFRAEGLTYNFVSERARQWFDMHFHKHVAFQKMDIA
jgi:hypothetical protein